MRGSSLVSRSDDGWAFEASDYHLLLRLRGTLAPFFRASDKPMAMACFRLFTLPPLPPLPDLRVPFLRRRIALSTRFCAALPYFRPPRDLRAGILFLPLV